MIEAAKIKLNYFTDIAGVTKMPLLSWQLTSTEKNTRQAAYEVQISMAEDFAQILYDSGIFYSEQSSGVKIDFPLETAKRYFIRVKVQATNGSWSKWSPNASFFSGIIGNKWQAEFITAESDADADKSNGTYLRREIGINKKIKAAYAYTTALGLYHFYINGQKIGTDEMTPGWTSYHKHLMYQSYDVREYLSEGRNALGAHIGAGWYKGLMGFNHTRNNYGRKTAFLAEIHVEYDDGSKEIFGTDESWQGSDSPVLFSEIYDGEIYDARKEQDGWNEAGFAAEGWRAVQKADYDFAILDPQYASRPGYNDTLQPKRLFKTPKGETVLDFGQNMTGWIEFSVQGQAGDKVILHCFEVLDADGNVYLDNLRDAKETIEYTCRGGKCEAYHPNFTFQGFQYAVIVEYPGEPKLEDFCAHTVHSVMAPTGQFECSNPDLNQLQHNILWGLKSNFLDIPTDCPQRDERLGWTGDAEIFSRTACFNVNTYAFYEKWLKDVAADQTAEGGVPHVVPDLLSGESDDNWLLSKGTHSASAWADAAVIIPWSMYLTFGDKNIIYQQYESMKKWVDFMHSHADEKGVWNYKLQFGDWVALDAEEGSYFGATPNDLVCSAYYAYSTGLFAKMAAAVDNKNDAVLYRKRYEKIVDQYRANFFDNEGNLTAQTQTAHVVSLYFNLAEEKYRAKTAKRLVELIKKENGHLVTGFVGTPYICHALSQNGYVKEAWDLLLKDDFPSWLYQVKQGATTIWEHWDGLKPDGTMWSPDMNSFNHYAYGAIGEWLYRAAAGLEIDEEQPGYKHTIFKPQFGRNLSYAQASYESVYGKTAIHWQIDGNNGCVDITVPVNTTASLYLDDVKNISDANDLLFEKTAKGYKTEVGSGEYHIKFVL